KLILALEQVEFVLVPEDLVPAVGALERVADVVNMMRMGVRLVRRRFVQQPGLRNAQPRRAPISRDQLEQRDLQRQRPLLVKSVIVGRSPEDQAAGEGQ